MNEIDKYPIEEDDVELYKALELIRQSGITNMWGAAPFLAEFTRVSQARARKALLAWISHYSELNQRFGWRD